MSIAWEEKIMRNFLTIARYEWKMQLKNPGFWLILAFGLFMGLMECFPSAANMARLDGQLEDSGYVAERLIRFTVGLMMFGIMFITANRIGRDRKLGVCELYMASPLKKGQYIIGKSSANLCVTLMIMAIFLAANAIVQVIFNPAPHNVFPYIIGFITLVIPMAVFTVGCAVSLPVLTDIRLSYVVLSGYFAFNEIYVVPDNRKIPFYLLAGEPRKIIAPYIGFGEKHLGLMIANWGFCLGTGILAVALLICAGKYWRGR
jgi:ABC-type transport system involved in multi-copper enzyme maturation permease subunit